MSSRKRFELCIIHSLWVEIYLNHPRNHNYFIQTLSIQQLAGRFFFPVQNEKD